MRYVILSLFLLGTLVSGCSRESLENTFKSVVVAPPSSIERDVKGHEQIYSVQAILRLAQRRSKNDSYAAYGISTYKVTPVPTFQQIDLSKDDEGNITIVSQRKTFDVIKSKDFYYGLELKYYDVNGKLINHQFSFYDEKDLDNSTLVHHQHFFSLQNYSLTTTSGSIEKGKQLLYPQTLDGRYYDRFTFQTGSGGEKVRSTITSPANILVPAEGYEPDHLKYDPKLVEVAIERALSVDAVRPYTDPSTGIVYHPYKALDQLQLNAKASEIFKYWYRDTDPVEDPLFSVLKGYDDLHRLRIGKPVARLQKKRDITRIDDYDHLGFKGILQFYVSDLQFQMRVCICHILGNDEKYRGTNGVYGGIRSFNEISAAWNTYDIDYPLPFRVIADLDGGLDGFVQQVRRIYPDADEGALRQMFGGGAEYFDHIPQISM